METDTDLRLHHSLIDTHNSIQLDEDFNGAGTLNEQLHLRILSVSPVVHAPTSCLLGCAPFRAVLNLDKLIAEKSAKIEFREVRVKVCNRHPEHSVTFADVSLLDTSLLHSFVDNSAPSLRPFLALVAPCTQPLSLFSPRISELNKLLALNFVYIQD